MRLSFLAPTAVLVWASIACDDRPSPVESMGVATAREAETQGPPTDVNDIFPADLCPGFQILVEISGKAKTIELPGGRTIITSPGLTSTLTNLENLKQVTVGITGSVHLEALENGNLEVVWAGRNALMDPFIPGPGLWLAIGTFSLVLDQQGNVVQPLQGAGQVIDECALLS
jgi:hypothetical protein